MILSSPQNVSSNMSVLTLLSTFCLCLLEVKDIGGCWVLLGLGLAIYDLLSMIGTTFLLYLRLSLENKLLDKNNFSNLTASFTVYHQTNPRKASWVSSSFSNEAATWHGAVSILLCQHSPPFVWLIFEWILVPFPWLPYCMVEVTVPI